MLNLSDLGPSNKVFFSESRFIVVEGIDGSGKSTLVKRMPEIIAGFSELRCETVWQPGYTPVGEQLRALFKTCPNLRHRTAHMLIEAARVDLLCYMQEKLDRGDCWFVSDRHVDSTWAYQGNEQVPVSQIQFTQMGFLDLPRPDVTIFLDVEPELAQERIKNSRGQNDDWYDNQPLQVFEFIRQGYYKRILRDRSRYLIVDANKSPDEVFNFVKENLNFINHGDRDIFLFNQ